MGKFHPMVHRSYVPSYRVGPDAPLALGAANTDPTPSTFADIDLGLPLCHGYLNIENERFSERGSMAVRQLVGESRLCEETRSALLQGERERQPTSST